MRTEENHQRVSLPIRCCDGVTPNDHAPPQSSEIEPGRRQVIIAVGADQSVRNRKPLRRNGLAGHEFHGLRRERHIESQLHHRARHSR